MITQTINLNLIPGGVLPRIKVSQYDKGSRVLQFNLFNGSSAFTIPVDASITIQGTKADNTGFQYACTFSGSTVTADLEQQMTVFAGEVECEIRIAQDDGDVLLGTCNFILDVEEAALKDDIIISETELPLVEKAAEAADAAEASALDAEAWAVGQRDGEDVPADDPAYHNNAKYYAETVPTLLTNYYTKSETYSKGEVDTALGGKQDTLTFDDSPTSDSSNPVKSGGIYTALAGKVDTEAGKGLSKNDFTDAEKAKVDNAVLWGQANKYIGKNELKVTKTSTTIQNIVYTVYKDSSGRILKINANGTTGASASAFYLNDGFSLETGAKYRLTDGVETHNNKRFLRIGNSTDGFLAGTVDGDNIEFTATETMTARISVEANQTVNIDYYPMIRKTAIADSAYEPYLPSNEELAGYNVGDIVRLDIAQGFGYVTNGKKNLTMFIPLPKPVNGTPSLSNTLFTVRGDNGYILSNTPLNTYTIDYVKVRPNGIEISLSSTTDFNVNTNNTPVSVYVNQATMTIS